MPTDDQKLAFAKRLEFALRRSQEPVNGATELALRFNLRYHGSPVSPQTAHKWLKGRAIPTGDKIQTLADWLNVEEHWLHYGPPPTQRAREKLKTGAEKPGAEILQLAAKIQNLPPHCRYLIEELVEQLGQSPA